MRERLKKIQLVGVSHIFDSGVEVLKNVDFELTLGKAFFLSGSLGSGKSHVLKILSGLVQPTAGQVFYNDKDIHTLTFEDFTPLRLSTAICFESGGLLTNKTLEDNLKLSLAYHKQWRTERSAERLNRLAEDFKISKHLHLRPAEVSEGIRRLAGLVRVFLTNPQVIFLDEPSLGLDDDSRQALKNWLQKHREDHEDNSSFITTQDKDLVSSLDSVKLVVENGTVKRAA